MRKASFLSVLVALSLLFFPRPLLSQGAPSATGADAPTASYEASAKALLAIGKEAEAKSLVAQGLQKASPPSIGLLTLNLALDTGRDSGLAMLSKLKDVDLANRAKYDALIQLYGSASGALFQETLNGEIPVIIRLKEKSECIETSSLHWGGQPAAAPPSANIASGMQGYGAGIRDISSSEGGKTKTMSTPPRVIVDLLLNGEKVAPFVLDSSSDVMLISPKVASKLKLQRFPPGEYDGIGLAARVSADRVLLKEIVVGPLTIRNVPALVIDQKADYWNETGGILPLWFLRHYCLHHDRRHSQLTLYLSGTSPSQILGARVFRLNMVWCGSRPFVETSLQGKPSCFMQVATATMGTYVELHRVGELGITVQTSKYGPRRERGLFGLISSGVADKVPLGLGHTQINLPTVLLANLCPDGEVNCTGVLGRNILDLFDMCFDYHANAFAMAGYEKGS